MPLARENRLAGGILAALLAIITLPYALAALLVPAGETWTGLLYTPDDQSVHLMWARQAQEGAFFFRDLFTTETLTSGERPLFWNALPALIGLLSRLTGLEVVFFYHAFRVGGAALALWQLHRLSRAVTHDEEKWALARLAALALASFTTGLGILSELVPGIIWLDQTNNVFPAMPEGFFLLSALFFPLNIVSFALLAFIFTQIARGEKPVATAIAALALANIHTYDALPLIAVALIWSIWQWSQNRRQTPPNRDMAEAKVALMAVAGACLPVLYQFVVFRGSAEFRVKALTVTAPPAIWHLALTYAPLLILAFVGWRALQGYRLRALLALWATVQLALVYAPTSLFPFARKMLEGWQLPLLVLAGAGSCWLCRRIAPSRCFVAGAALLILLAASPFQFLRTTVHFYVENNETLWDNMVSPLRLFDSETRALRALEKASGAGAVLSLPHLGLYVPRISGRTTYLGHWAETLYPQRKFAQVLRFYSGTMLPAEARDLMRDNRVRYVLVSRFERGLIGPAFEPAALGLRPFGVWGTGNARVEVYEFAP